MCRNDISGRYDAIYSTEEITVIAIIQSENKHMDYDYLRVIRRTASFHKSLVSLMHQIATDYSKCARKKNLK